jgi:hypothetical protein
MDKERAINRASATNSADQMPTANDRRAGTLGESKYLARGVFDGKLRSGMESFPRKQTIAMNHNCAMNHNRLNSQSQITAITARQLF